MTTLEPVVYNFCKIQPVISRCSVKVDFNEHLGLKSIGCLLRLLLVLN